MPPAFFRHLAALCARVRVRVCRGRLVPALSGVRISMIKTVVTRHRCLDHGWRGGELPLQLLPWQSSYCQPHQTTFLCLTPEPSGPCLLDHRHAKSHHDPADPLDTFFLERNVAATLFNQDAVLSPGCQTQRDISVYQHRCWSPFHVFSSLFKGST